MRRLSFWSGLAAGMAGALAGFGVLGILSSRKGSISVHRSVRISSPVAEVFAAVAHLEHFPQLIRSVVSVATLHDLSLWTAQIEGQRYEWDLEIVQVIPGRAIAWSSHSGVRHSGRLWLFAMNSETLLQLELTIFPSLFTSLFWLRGAGWLDRVVANGLADLKNGIETGRATRSGPAPRPDMERATGTHGIPRSMGAEEVRKLESQGGF